MGKISEKKKKWIERTVSNDRSYKVFLYNRFFFFLSAVLLQLVGYGILLYFLVYNSAIAAALQLIVFILELIFVLYILNKNDRPSSKISWIIIILLVPVFGVPMYLINGRGRPTKKMNKKMQSAKEQVDKAFEEIYGTRTECEEGISRYLDKVAGYPVYTDGDVTYFESGEKMFPEMLKELEKAEKFILLEYFIIAHGKMWQEILKILLQKASEGVKIRIIYDDFGCMMTLPPNYEKYLESLNENIKCMTFNDVVPFFSVRMNNRDHRKILVIDGKTAFTGGINLADEYIGEKQRFGYWKDTGVKVTGSAVSSFTRMFFYIWNAFRKDNEDVKNYFISYKKTDAQGIRIQPYDDSPLDGVSVGEGVYLDVINRAAKYVYIFTPYLVLDDFLRSALCSAALRGVDVRIVTPGIPDKKMTYRLTRANYEILLQAGVKIYEYTPGFIHAKGMVSDGERAVVGTINLDYRSLYLHFENAVYFSGCQAVTDFQRDAESVFTVSKQRTKENSKRGIVGRFIDSLLRVFETLM